MSELDDMLASIKNAGPAIAEVNAEAEEIGRDVGTIEAALAQAEIYIKAQVHLSVTALKIDGSAASTVGLNSGGNLYLSYGRTKDEGWGLLLHTDGGAPVVPFKEAHRGLRILSKRLLPMLVKQIHGEITIQKRMIQPNADQRKAQIEAEAMAADRMDADRRNL